MNERLDHAAPIASKVRSIEAAAVAGLIYSALAITTIQLLNRPPSLSFSEVELTAWYADDGNRAGLLLALNLSAVAAIAFLWFVAVIRRRIGEREDKFFATVFLGASISFVMTWIIAATATAAPAVASTMLDAATVSPAAVTVSSGMSEGLLLVVAPRLQAVFVFTTSTIVLRTRALPTWLAYLGYVFGLLLFVTPLITRPVGYAFPVWVALVSVQLLVSRPKGELRIGPAGSTGDPEPDESS